MMSTKRISFLFSLIFVSSLFLIPCQAQSSQVNAEGYVPLFNGKDLSGWHTFKKEKASPVWTVSDGAIYFDPSQKGDRGDLVTDQKFKNFELTLDWKISKKGNSGILFGVQENPDSKRTWTTGPEMQVLDNKDASDNKKDNHLAGSLYDLLPADPAFVHPAEEWNQIKIRRQNNHLTFWMNGHKVVETQIGSEAWNKMVEESKFRPHSGFAAFEEGRIALQDHGNEVWFKNIKIKELK